MGLFKITLSENLNSRWDQEFMSFKILRLPEGTILMGVFEDQSALLGFVNRLHNFGFTLIGINRIQRVQELTPVENELEVI